jgi:DNA-binding MarR family transcriptional regulator
MRRESDVPQGRGFDADTRSSIGYLLRDTSRLVLRDFAAQLDPHGISASQYFVLRELWHEEGLTQRELANRVGVLEPMMVATLDALERAGLVLRSRSTEDRRKINVSLTRKAKQMRDRFLGYAASTLERALDGVSDSDVVRTRRVLQRIKDNLENPPS